MNKILVVEDNPDMRSLLVLQIEQLGFSVIPAKHGKEGMEKALQERPQLILMDIMMPEMDGREAIRMLRSNPETRDIPIVAATVLFRDADLSSLIEAGCDDYLIKPFTARELQDKLKKFLPLPKDIAT